MDSKIKIHRVGVEERKKTSSIKPPSDERKKTHRTYPRSSIKGTKNPSKAPPLRKGTIRILTEHGARNRRATIKQKVETMSDGEVRSRLSKAKMAVSPKTPNALAREILKSGAEAGMIPV